MTNRSNNTMAGARLTNPTHRIADEFRTYVLLSLRGDRTGSKLLSNDEVKRSRSPSLACDMIVGNWHSPINYLFGQDANHVPRSAIVEPLPWLALPPRSSNLFERVMNGADVSWRRGMLVRYAGGWLEPQGAPARRHSRCGGARGRASGARALDRPATRTLDYSVDCVAD